MEHWIGEDPILLTRFTERMDGRVDMPEEEEEEKEKEKVPLPVDRSTHQGVQQTTKAPRRNGGEWKSWARSLSRD